MENLSRYISVDIFKFTHKISAKILCLSESVCVLQRLWMHHLKKWVILNEIVDGCLIVHCIVN